MPIVLQDRVELYLLQQAGRLFAPLPEIMGNGDAEALHQMRVSSRRLRVGLRFFSKLFAPVELNQVLRQLRRITQALGEIRALDVNIQLMQKLARQVLPGLRGTCATVRQNMLVERNVRTAELRELINTLEIRKFARRIEALIKHRNQQVDTGRLVRSTNKQLADLRRRLRCRYTRYGKKQNSESFHRMRIAAKRYRYGLEAGEAVFRAGEAARIRQVEKLQDRMGEAHDLEVLREYLKEARDRWGADDKELAGRLGHLIQFVRNEHRQRLGKFEDFLAADRSWLKKVKLKLRDD